MNAMPSVKGFKPYGQRQDGGEPAAVRLQLEEYEAITLCDYHQYNHHQAAVKMQVSRPTFTRIYAEARSKIARALAEGRAIVIEGGKVFFDSEWYHCQACQCDFNHPDGHAAIPECPLCGSTAVHQYPGEGPVEGGTQAAQHLCRCPECGYTQPHVPGRPCRQERCPKCRHTLSRQNEKK